MLHAAETWNLTQTDRRLDLKCGYGEEWKGSADWIKLVMRKFLEQQMKTLKY